MIQEACGVQKFICSQQESQDRRTAFEFAPLADAGMLSPMNSISRNSANPLIAKGQQLFSRDLALENDYLRQENRILRSKLGARVSLTEADRRVLVKYGLRIKDRLAEVISIAQPDTLLAWNRRQKRKKWTFQNASAKAGRPRKTGDAEALIVRLAEDNHCWGLQANLGGVEEAGTPRLSQLRARRASAPWPAACSRSQRAVVEAISPGAFGGHLGDGLLDRRGLDDGRIGDHLRSVLFASGQSASVDGRLHAATARRLDGATGQKFLHGRGGLGTTVSVSGP